MTPDADISAASHLPSRHDTTRLYTPSSLPSIDAFASICSRQATSAEYPLSSSINSSIPHMARRRSWMRWSYIET